MKYYFEFGSLAGECSRVCVKSDSLPDAVKVAERWYVEHVGSLSGKSVYAGTSPFDLKKIKAW